MTDQNGPSPKTGGFTQVEVMVSMTLLSVGALALTSFTRTISGNGIPLKTP